MLDNARQLIESYALGKRVAVAVSGGEDSMALLRLFSEFRDEGKLSVLAVNVDHGIRKNSAADSAFVREYCVGHNIEFFGKVTDIPALCSLSGRGIESEAHFFRRALFAELINSGRADLVATAHHARDNAETVLLHLFRGCGLKGLSGMRILSPEGIFRPFLTTGKEEITGYVKANKIPFVTDETNADNSYNRNYIRNVILPAVRERFPYAEKSICRTAQFAGDADKFITDKLDKSAIFECDGAVSLKCEYLSPPYIFEALRWLGESADVYSTAIDSVMSLGDCKSGARVDIGNGIIAASEYGVITFYRKRDDVRKTAVPFDLPEDNKKITATAAGFVKIERVAPPYLPAKKGTVVFDADKLPQGCVLRSRRWGDMFTPFGGGRRKLKEFFIDKKVPQRLRDSVALLCCGAEVLAIAGMEISSSVKVDEHSVNVYGISMCDNPRE